ncbi:hypothetical protein Zm00014a_020856 [Zea mays]|uniref:Uncharacterized protein n=1 Tax=Zea mays TaxID=4577 RepID=A0A3L6DSA3_MAIZE|nr:hypothetical protein Zm00014a_020856 [Zea mays]
MALTYHQRRGRPCSPPRMALTYLQRVEPPSTGRTFHRPALNPDPLPPTVLYKNRSPIHDRHDNLKETLQRSRDSASLFVERMQHTWPSFNAEQSDLGWILAKLGYNGCRDNSSFLVSLPMSHRLRRPRTWSIWLKAEGASTEQALSSALTSIMDALKSTDWNTRKDASQSRHCCKVDIPYFYSSCFMDMMVTLQRLQAL